MKNRLFLLLACCIFFSGCEKLGNKVMDITNNAEFDILVYHPLIWNPNRAEAFALCNYYNYPDTSLSPRMPSNIKRVSGAGEWCPLYENRYKYFFEEMKDTMSMFIFNADSLDRYGWDSIDTHDILIQRYDFNAEMLVEFEGDDGHGHWIEILAFPPTKRMSEYIKMWPPYGTYDATGHRIDSK